MLYISEYQKFNRHSAFSIFAYLKRIYKNYPGTELKKKVKINLKEKIM